jgi:predicted nucleic acid-binding Zn ribbon protein
VEKTWKNAASQGREQAGKRGENVEKCRIPGASRKKTMKLMMMMMVVVGVMVVVMVTMITETMMM